MCLLSKRVEVLRQKSKRSGWFGSDCTIVRRALISGPKSQPPLGRAAKYSGLLFLLGLYLSLFLVGL